MPQATQNPHDTSGPLPDTYAALHAGFRWHVPPRFNIATACSARWAADAGRVAIRHEDEHGATATLTYTDLQTQANRLSNLLHERGVQRGDRVALILPQRCETAIAHMACLQMGAVAMPLSILFGPDALSYRLQDSGAVLAVVDDAGLAPLQSVLADCPALRSVVCIGQNDGANESRNPPANASPDALTNSGTPGNLSESRGPDAASVCFLSWSAALSAQRAQFDAVDTAAADPAILIYTSGTTGAPKGALLAHAALIGNLPGFVASQNWFPQAGDVFWSPADWAWTGGLMDALLPTLYFGQTIIGYRGRFSAETAFRLMEKYRVTNTFLFPTALKIMMKSDGAPREKYRLHLRAIMSAGEAVGDAVFTWSQEALGVTINEMFGQTEMNYIVGNSAEKWAARAGSMGRPYPGHRVAVIDDAGVPVAPGVVGEVALNRNDVHGDPDPIFFLGYWNNPQADADKFSGDWCRTGDLACADADGYLWYRGRADDMFKAAGYRIGPSEIENCLLKHPSVANAAVVPRPDPERGNLVKAYVVLVPGIARSADADASLVTALQDHVRGKLAPYEYPKEIEFIDALPMTTTGKVQRRVLRLQEEARAAAAAPEASLRRERPA